MAHDSSDEFLTGLRTLYAPSADPEWRRQSFELFSKLIAFLQSNRLAKREIVKPGERPNTRTEIWRSDLTDEGNRVFDTAYIKWLEALDRGRPTSDTTVLERALAKIRGPGGAPVVKAPAPAPLKSAMKRKRKPQANKPEADLSGEPESDAELEAEFRKAGPEVHDKAKWHYEGDFPKNLPRKQAFVHTGIRYGTVEGSGLSFVVGPLVPVSKADMAKRGLEIISEALRFYKRWPVSTKFQPELTTMGTQARSKFINLHKFVTIYQADKWFISIEPRHRTGRGWRGLTGHYRETKRFRLPLTQKLFHQELTSAFERAT